MAWSQKFRKSDISLDTERFASHERYLSIDLYFLIAIVAWEESLNNFENFKKLWCQPQFFTKNIRIKNDFLMDTYSMTLAWVQRWNISEKLIKLWCRNNYFSCDQHFVILAKAQNWSIYEEIEKLCSPPEFLHKNTSHEQLLFTWSTFRDSSMGTKLKNF